MLSCVVWSQSLARRSRVVKSPGHLILLLLSCVNCHISRLVDASQIRVSSSRSVKPLSPFGGLCIVQSSMMCCTDWFGAPHSHSEVDFRPHLFMASPNLLHPFGYGCRLSTVCAAGPVRPGTWSGVLMNECSLECSAARHSSFHLVLSQVRLETSSGVERKRRWACSANGRLDFRRAGEGLSEMTRWRMWSSSFASFRVSARTAASRRMVGAWGDSSEDGKLVDWDGTQTSSHCPHGAVENCVQLLRVGTSTPDRSTVLSR